MPHQQRLEEATVWLRYAAADMRVVELLLSQGDSDLIRQALLHAQQAAEKALKAFLIFQGIAYPLSHNLNQLRRLCIAQDPSLEAYALACIALSPYAGALRYPGPTPVMEEEMARELVLAANDLLEAIAMRLGLVLS